MSGGVEGNMKLRTIIVMAGILVALGVVFLISSRPKTEPQAEPRPFVWSVEMGDLKAMAINLPHEEKSEAWVKHEDQYWYFDKPEGPKVNMKRWGGGIPLLLSGPGADRLIADNATDEQLGMYGLKDPKMKIDLVLENEDTIHIEIGDRTLDGQAYYIKMIDSTTVFTVDYTWHDVLRGLVLEPPYPEPDGQ